MPITKTRVKRTCLLLPDSKQLYLPMKSNISIDEYLQSYNSIVENAKILTSKGEHLIVASNNNDDDILDLSYEYCNRLIIKDEKILNICQREVGHTIPCQNDIIVSDNATTCHILALHSTSNSSNSFSKPPLSSLAHIDKPSCDETSIRNMIHTHIKYHNHVPHHRIEMKIHIVGGFDDDDGCSRFISNFLIRILAEIAQEHSAYLRMTLQSCLISSLNDSYGLPIGRGLAMNTTTGEAFLAQVHSSALGPEIALRCSRIFSDSKKLSIIHTHEGQRPNCSISSSIIQISPFSYHPNLDTINFLLQLPDSVLLQYTSTSPHAEREDFCKDFRMMANYMKRNRCEDVFEKHCNRPMMFERKSDDFEMIRWVRI